MTAYCLQPVLPWSGLREEDRRFRLILAGVLAVFLAFGYIVPLLPLPKIEPPWDADLPPRLAGIIEDRIESTTLPPASGQLTTQEPVAASRPEPETAPVSTPEADTAATEEKPVAAAPPEPETTPVSTPEAEKTTTEEKPVAAARAEPEPAPVSTPEADKLAIEEAARKKAASTGILALSDSLSELRKSVPKVAAAVSEPSTGVAGAQAIVRRPSVLAEGIAGASGGSAGEIVAHQTVLGTSGLQPREITRQGGLGEGAGALPAPRGASGTERRSVRSEDEIQEILDRNKRAIYMIYNRELTKDPKLQGKVVLSITIAPSGQVTECRVIYSELNAASMEEKLVLLIKRIDFGAKRGIPVVTTRVPIEFFPV